MPGGGCTIPNLFIPTEAQVRGVDCSGLPGVDDVTCSSGACVVLRCKNGWALSSRGDSCQRISFNATSELVAQTTTTRRALKRMKKVKQRRSGGTTSNSGSATIVGVLTRRDPRASEENVITAVDSAIESDLGISDLHGADLNLALASDVMDGTVTYLDLDGLVSPDLHASDSAIGALLATP